jgi:hypothetical protein
MSLLLIAKKLWKYKLFTVPIFALVLVGSFYVFAVKAPTYESSATYILVSPPPPPTDAEIAADPALGRVKADNPYLRFSDQTVVVQILASRLNSDEGRQALAKQGADPNYLAQPSPEFGFSAPILQVTGTGTTAAAAIKTADVVGEAAGQELDRMQQERGVDRTYRIKVETVVAAHDAMLKASGKLRALVAVFVLGMILLFITVSVLDALSALRAEWAKRGHTNESYDDGTSFVPPLTLARDTESVSDSDQEAPQWPIEAQR